MQESLGGGSLTALPIIETQAGDVSAYIPTNVISITDGQVFLEPSLFFSGVRPAINVGLSVSRVGGNAQVKAMKQVAGSLRLDLAQYRELAAFAQFGSELDKSTQAQLEPRGSFGGDPETTPVSAHAHGKDDYSLFAGTRGFLDDLPVETLQDFEPQMIVFIESKHPDILSEIKEKKEISPELEEKMKKAIGEFKTQFQAQHK